MPFKGNDFQHTRAEAYTAETYDKYGEEHDRAMEDRVNVENGVRSFWAARLQTLVDEAPEYAREGLLLAVAMLDPYNGKDGSDGRFARTVLGAGPEGDRRVIPGLDHVK